MKLIPKYSYEMNKVLNESFSEDEQIKNFASLISDKDRFLTMLPLLEKNSKLISERLDFKTNDEYEFYVTRCEKFKSFSEPITIEYSILPEEMFVFLLKEIVKTTINERFVSDESREKYVNSFVDFILVNGDFNGADYVKFGKNLHDESKRLFPNYEFEDIDFKETTMREHMEKMFEEEMNCGN